MSFRLTIFCFAALLCACSESRREEDSFKPEQYLSPEQQRAIIEKTVRFSTKLAPNASHETKFDAEFDWYYAKAADETALLMYHIGEDSSQYFLMAREARSLTPMKEGIGGRLKRGKNGEVTAYEEIFRTWKMPADTLLKRGPLLFKRMVNGQDLTLYYSKYQQDRYIEFPDDRFTFDKDEKRWRDRELDTLQIN